MSAEYDVYLLAPDADYALAHIDFGSSAPTTYPTRTAAGWLEYTKVQNDVGSFRIGLPYPQFDPTMLRLDARLVVWRKPAYGMRYLDFAGLVRSDPCDFYQRGSAVYLEARGVDYNHILKRREIAAFAGSAESNKTGAADYVMKAYVKENLGTLATADRDISSVGFTVQADIFPGYPIGLGTIISKAATYRNLLETLQEISDDSHSIEATSTYFGIVPTGSGSTMEFRTNITQFAQDHRHPSGPTGFNGAQGPVVIGLDRQNLDNATLIQDRVDEVTFVYGLGPGEGAARNVQTAADTTRAGASPLNRIETSINASNASSNAEVSAAAQAKLRDGRPRKSFSGTLVETPGTRYGIDWGHGDYLTAVFAGRVMDCRVDAVTVRISDGKESVNATLRSEEFTAPVSPPT
jgi:hypothetical protein